VIGSRNIQKLVVQFVSNLNLLASSCLEKIVTLVKIVNEAVKNKRGKQMRT